MGGEWEEGCCLVGGIVGLILVGVSYLYIGPLGTNNVDKTRRPTSPHMRWNGEEGLVSTSLVVRT